MLELLDIITEEEIDYIKQYQEISEKYHKGHISSHEYVDLSDSCMLTLSKKIINFKSEDILRIIKYLPQGFYRSELLTYIKLKSN